MKHRVYLRDWLFNAGVIGFLRIILGDNALEEQNNIVIGNNYIEFDRDILKGFSAKFFETAFKQYGRYDRYIELVTDLIRELNANPDDKPFLKSRYDLFKSKLSSFTALKTEVGGLPDKNLLEQGSNNFVSYLRNVKEILINKRNFFRENDVVIYLGKIYGKKSFLNPVNMNKRIKNGEIENKFEQFKLDFEDSLLKDRNNYEKKKICRACEERKAKKNTNFDTGISPFAGVNTDAANFFWNFKAELPLCDICELIYLCYFAGLTDVSETGKSKFYFVNDDNSIHDLFRSNQLLSMVLQKNIKENLIIDFFSGLMLEQQRQRSYFSLMHIPCIELDLTNRTFPSIFSLNINRHKAKLFTDKYDLFLTIQKAGYKVKKDTYNLLNDLIMKLLTDKIGYRYLYKLTKIYLSASFSKEKDKKNQLYTIWFSPYQLQMIHVITYSYYLIINKEDTMEPVKTVDEKELWAFYKKGQELSRLLKDSEHKAGNKIPTIAYRLLTALRTGDSNYFIEVLTRIYMTYNNHIIPLNFVNSLSSKDIFQASGHSFLNGFLQDNSQDNSQDNKSE